MKKKILTAVLTMAMAVSSVTAFAAETPENVIVCSAPIQKVEVMTRADAVKRLWEMSGKPVVNYAMQFEDVAGDSDYAEAVR